MPAKSPSVSFLAILTATYAVGFVGTLAINSAVGFWYITLNRPAWAFPNWSIVPLWLVLHGFIGVASWQTYQDPEVELNRAKPLAFVAGALVLNTAWSCVFFYAHHLLPALVVSALLWFLTLAAVISTWRALETAGRLLIPFLLWSTYILALTGVTWRLNP